jgi:hypothetical protein
MKNTRYILIWIAIAIIAPVVIPSVFMYLILLVINIGVDFKEVIGAIIGFNTLLFPITIANIYFGVKYINYCSKNNHQVTISNVFRYVRWKINNNRFTRTDDNWNKNWWLY